MSNSKNKNKAEKSGGLPELSQAEYTVLRPLWRQSPLSVRAVYEAVNAGTGWAYTTTKTVMDRMVSKGFLERERQDGVFVYAPMISKPAGLARMVKFFADRVLEVDEQAVVSMFKGTGSLTADEVDELTRLIEEDHGSKKHGKDD
jgi:predicted transcriptional regulator